MTKRLPKHAVQCSECGAEFYRTANSQTLTCGSVECRRKNHMHNIQNRREAHLAELAARASAEAEVIDPAHSVRLCRICGKEYTSKRTRQFTCGSVECVRLNKCYRTAPVAHQTPKTLVRCIRSNEFYRAGHDYDFYLVMDDINAAKTMQRLTGATLKPVEKGDFAL